MEKKLKEISRPGLATGKYAIDIIPQQIGLPVSNYVYQLRVENTSGVYRQAKMMTSM